MVSSAIKLFSATKTGVFGPKTLFQPCLVCFENGKWKSAIKALKIVSFFNPSFNCLVCCAFGNALDVCVGRGDSINFLFLLLSSINFLYTLNVKSSFDIDGLFPVISLYVQSYTSAWSFERLRRALNKWTRGRHLQPKWKSISEENESQTIAESKRKTF